MTNRSSANDRFLSSLEHCGLGDFASMFLPERLGTHAYAAHLDACPASVALAARLCLLGEAVERSAVDRVLDLDFLLEERLLHHVVVDGVEQVRLANLVLNLVDNLWVFAQAPTANPTVYIGHDTYGLLARLRVRSGDRVLDLCAGPGTQGLAMAARGGDVTAVEINPVAADIARLNCRLNGLSDRYAMRVGDLYNALPQDAHTFDLVCANPPLLPFPDGQFYPFVGHGGEDGLAVTWRILNGLPAVLSPGGRAKIIGTSPSDGFLLCAHSRLLDHAQRLGLDILVGLINHAPFRRGDPTFNGLVSTARASGNTAATEQLQDQFDAVMGSQGANSLAYFVLHVTRGHGRVQTMDLSAGAWPALWFADV